MKNLFLLLMLAAGIGFAPAAGAQNFRAKQRSQEKTIKAALKSGKITEREYNKLMDEQEAIRTAIVKYQADDMWTPHEKNVVHDKLVRAEKRLRRYRTNGEVY